MPKDNRDFFKTKKIWSEVKDELLGCYLVPYFNKILSMGNPILYVDCFAGKGKFDDGKNGSPLTALQSLEKSITAYHGRVPMPDVLMSFIELNYASDLTNNLIGQSAGKCQVISGRFEDNIIPLLRKSISQYRQLNVFLYVDPYGVKVLNANLFDSVATAFRTAELLINLNSFGFIREACRVKKISFRERESEIFSDLEEYDSSILESVQELNNVAGGTYWQEVIDKYGRGEIDCYDAEKEFSRLYKERLRENYNYVLEIQSGGQMSLLQQTAENEIISEETLMEKMKELLENTPSFIRLNQLLADFYNQYGVLCDLSHLSSGRSGSILKTLEKSGYIEVQRQPAYTEKGTATTFWQEHQGKTISLRKRRELLWTL